MLQSINPANLEVLNTYQQMQLSEVSTIINLTNIAFESWRETTFTHRAKLMMNAAEVLRKNKEDYSSLMTLEMGKPISQARAEVDKCAWVCEYYAENAENFYRQLIEQML
jgi:succinate-semialdehyde dehydrogenase/glutarate-semialdehyde dehydrogenase